VPDNHLSQNISCKTRICRVSLVFYYLKFMAYCRFRSVTSGYGRTRFIFLDLGAWLRSIVQCRGQGHAVKRQGQELDHDDQNNRTQNDSLSR